MIYGKEVMAMKTNANTQKISLLKKLKRDRQLIVLLMPGLIFYIIFRYGPMYGLVIAFKKYSPFKGVAASPWVGLDNFIRFFSNSDFRILLRNTLLLGAYNLLWSFPITILFALLLNEVRHRTYKKLVQTVSYLPTFLSLVIICSMTIDILSPGGGLINKILNLLGMDSIYFMQDPRWFRTVYIASGIWAGMGSGAIIYLAALSGVDISLYEAARIDGCSRIKMIWHITLPSIMPTIVTMFILNTANIFRVGADKILLLYNPLTYEVADVFSTYLYRMAFTNHDYGYASAVGMFESVVCGIVLFVTNRISRKVTNESLW
ncbi:sugar ABC transporter permease [Clostridium thermosuccinogenes]|uniref:Sugar ABC transporter permease n=2 Tax=Clostridium thermosuccinogenes TaxID=84032 RepID=A0A2K2F6G6_9CLOT|nr:sugar ABC transporter permease [Pseudoclostridium thermosuccinogenes]PNT94368.1 sugar ABC transporter permease [Pseudoclostridium thermosuccinogenes]PNT95362.1 sugar ABC transporter permease [Pseudoclostridium thermosuccinogenes]PNT96376.1 sugar ABC transporter permease [Pseudoclostridium thermosuccinogenes]